jgi:hypothetical protein
VELASLASSIQVQGHPYFLRYCRILLLVSVLAIDEAASFDMAWYNLRPLKASVGVTAANSDFVT